MDATGFSVGGNTSITYGFPELGQSGTAPDVGLFGQMGQMGDPGMFMMPDSSTVSLAQHEAVVQKQAALTSEMQHLKSYVFQMHNALAKSNTDLLAGAAASNAKIQELQEQLGRSHARSDGQVVPHEDTLDQQRESSTGPERTGQDSRNQKDGGVRASRKRDVEIVVHKKMLALIGLTYDGENKSLTVPPIPDEPLVIPETGAAAADPQATSDGGVSQDPYIWTPDWRVGTVNPYNNAFVKHVAAQIIADEMHLDAKDRVFMPMSQKNQRQKITRYLETLSRRYREQVDPATGLKAKAKGSVHKRGARRDRLAIEYAKVAPLVEDDLTKKFGKDEANGISLLIHESWMDAYHSDSGEASKEDWDARKQAMGGNMSQPAWEARKPRFKSRKLRQIYLLLHRKMRELKQDQSIGSTFIFPGLAINASDAAPDLREKPNQVPITPWRACFDESWIERSGSKIEFRDTDDSVSVLRLNLDELFDTKDEPWLADDEADDEADDQM